MTTATKSSIGLPQLQAPASPYIAYTYSYPHKSAYRPLLPQRSLARVWAGEPRHALFLYMHVPFCEMRCGFCNLFTTANPAEEIVSAYVRTLRRQAEIVHQTIGPIHAARAAIGGGTPTYLPAAALDEVLGVAGRFGVAAGAVPISVETSPRTAEADRLRVLKSHGVSRISIGVQSFVEEEVAAAGRAQKNVWVQTALERIRDVGFPVLNIDLIYGLPGQSVASWLATLRAALRWRPEEIYLYPLYVRPLTGLDRHGCETPDDLRLDSYRAGRALLLSEGYAQVSMRMFRRCDARGGEQDPVYCCQQDGMIGLGCGARSYTRGLHYSTDYAVRASGVREIISSYLARSDEQFQHADYGRDISEDEHRRRWVIKSLLRSCGLERAVYQRTFAADVLEDFPQLVQLLDGGYLEAAESVLRPTAMGLEWSDAIGPLLFSDDVRRMMAEFALR